jgi:hypothetical protein
MKPALVYLVATCVAAVTVALGIWWFARPTSEPSDESAYAPNAVENYSENSPVTVESGAPSGTSEKMETNAIHGTPLARTLVYSNGVVITNWVPVSFKPVDQAKVLARNQERRRQNAAAGRMQDVAEAEARIVAGIRSLREGMTVAEAIEVMGPPHAVTMSLERDEHGVLGIREGTLEEALRSPETVWRLLYTPYPEEVAKATELALGAGMRRFPGPYQRFELRFGRFEDETRGILQHWSMPLVDDLPP